MSEPGHLYDQDGLRSHYAELRTIPLMRSLSSRHTRWHWRVHVGLKEPAALLKIKEIFVECGVERAL